MRFNYQGLSATYLEFPQWLVAEHMNTDGQKRNTKPLL